MTIYFVLSKYAHSEKQTCYPSFQTIMEKSDVGNRNTISKYLDILERLNIIHIKRREGTSNFYTLISVKYWKDHSVLKQAESETDTCIDNDTGGVTKTNEKQYQNRDGCSNTNERGSINSDTQSNINNSNQLTNIKECQQKNENKDIGWLRSKMEDDGVL
jgi:DNA-binding transcriptional regulator YhcF (GntR family)